MAPRGIVSAKAGTYAIRRRIWAAISGTMIRLSAFTPRMWLILAYDLLATAAAVIASFFIRFEEGGLAERWRFLAIMLPAFVVYSGFVYAFSDLYKAKWRFTSLPDLFNIVRAATVLATTLLALDYVLLAPNVYGTFFFGKSKEFLGSCGCARVVAAEDVGRRDIP